MPNPFHAVYNPRWAKDHGWIIKTIYWRARCNLAEWIIKRVLSGRAIGRACHIHDLEAKISSLREELTHQREAAEVRNKQLKAANLIVTCTGGCEGGVMGDHNKLTEEMVFEVEMIAARLRAKLVNLTHSRERDNAR